MPPRKKPEKAPIENFDLVMQGLNEAVEIAEAIEPAPLPALKITRASLITMGQEPKKEPSYEI